jgi:hypothetical protein
LIKNDAKPQGSRSNLKKGLNTMFIIKHISPPREPSEPKAKKAHQKSTNPQINQDRNNNQH